ncbi:cysteine hydrolase family protein [Ottowia caeni]|uniref:cysteine hydrolase family protein n=1 Tax=Ottowia caeni TaxID=2870339 RepID=UPI001E5665F8|nr:cysteine hydrolase [Ottowia caeni]
MKPALLIVDMQQALCQGEAQPFDCKGVIGRINELARAARAAQVPVIWAQHENAARLRSGTPGWEIAKGLEVDPADLRVSKATPDAFNGTGLEALLKERAVDTLIICGIHTEFCIDTTCRRALALGWPVLLAQDAHTSAGNAVLAPEQVIAHHNATLTAIASYGPRVQTWPTEALLHALNSL